MLIKVFLFILIFFAGLIVGIFIIRPRLKNRLEESTNKANEILGAAQKEASQFKEDTFEKIEKNKTRITEEEVRFKIHSERLEKTLTSLESSLKIVETENSQINELILKENQKIQFIEKEIKSLSEQKLPTLIKVSGFKVDEIKTQILNDLDNDLELAREDRLRKYEEYLKEESERIAKNMLINVIQRYSAPTSVEKKSLIIPINRDETRTKIIGKNAEFLNFIEQETGVDIIFNDNSSGITISCFDLVKKHIARETIIKLMRERYLNFDKVKAKLQEAQNETSKLLFEIGKKVIRELRLENRNYPPEFLKILGRLKFRTSYGQNILKHSFEVGYFTLMLGNELGLDMSVCKIGGFFHDLGKAIDQEDGRPHDILTKEIMEKFNFSFDETHAAWTHHDAIPQETAEAMLVKAGDAISAGRPGARQETIEKYIERITAMEAIANSYEGVNKSYAISGGREIRVIVDPKDLDDENLPELAKTIAGEIEENVAYPGKIKVNVIRRVQNISIAKEKKAKK